MRFYNGFLSLLFLMILLSCSSFQTASGTGHEGEARIIGVVHTADGGVYRNGKLFLASEDYLPSYSRSDTGIEIYTDRDGRINVLVRPNESYVLSGKVGTKMLFRRVVSDGDTVHLENLRFRVGMPITIHPADDEGISFEELLVPGTNWRFSLDPAISEELYLPEEELLIVRRGTAKTSTGIEPVEEILSVEVIAGSEVGVAPQESTGVAVPVSYFLSNPIMTGAACTLFVDNAELDDLYLIDWGDTVGVTDSVLYQDSVAADSTLTMTYWYSAPGLYPVSFVRYREEDTAYVYDTIDVRDTL